MANTLPLESVEIGPDATLQLSSHESAGRGLVSCESGRVTCLLVGLGSRSLNDYIPKLEQSPDVDLVGACDIDLGAPARQQLNVPCFTGLDAALAATQPTMAIVATPHDTHLEITERLIAAGVAVLKEKPFALNLQEAQRLRKLVKLHQGFLRVCVQRQHHPLFNIARSSLRKLGKLRHFDAAYTLNTAAYGETWRGSKEHAGGGALLDMGYHILDLLLTYFGMPQSVIAIQIPGRAGHRNAGIEESIAGIMEYDEGLVGRLFLSRCEPEKRDQLTVTGTDGSLEVTRDTLCRRDRAGNVCERMTREPAWPDGVGDVLAAFVGSIGDHVTARDECDRGVQVMELASALYQSMGQRQLFSAGDGDVDFGGIAAPQWQVT